MAHDTETLTVFAMKRLGELRGSIKRAEAPGGITPVDLDPGTFADWAREINSILMELAEAIEMTPRALARLISVTEK